MHLAFLLYYRSKVWDKST